MTTDLGFPNELELIQWTTESKPVFDIHTLVLHDMQNRMTLHCNPC